MRTGYTEVNFCWCDFRIVECVEDNELRKILERVERHFKRLAIKDFTYITNQSNFYTKRQSYFIMDGKEIHADSAEDFLGIFSFNPCEERKNKTYFMENLDYIFRD